MHFGEPPAGVTEQIAEARERLAHVEAALEKALLGVARGQRDVVGRGVFGIGVNLVEIARQPGEGDDVGLGDRPAGRAQLHADLEVFKIQAFGLIDKFGHRFLIR